MAKAQPFSHEQDTHTFTHTVQYVSNTEPYTTLYCIHIQTQKDKPTLEELKPFFSLFFLSNDAMTKMLITAKKRNDCKYQTAISMYHHHYDH